MLLKRSIKRGLMSSEQAAEAASASENQNVIFTFQLNKGNQNIDRYLDINNLLLHAIDVMALLGDGKQKQDIKYKTFEDMLYDAYKSNGLLRHKWVARIKGEKKYVDVLGGRLNKEDFIILWGKYKALLSELLYIDGDVGQYFAENMGTLLHTGYITRLIEKKERADHGFCNKFHICELAQYGFLKPFMNTRLPGIDTLFFFQKSLDTKFLYRADLYEAHEEVASDILEKITKAGVDLDVTSVNSLESPIIKALEHNNEPLAALLIEFGVNLNDSTKESIFLKGRFNESVSEKLIKLGAKPTIEDVFEAMNYKNIPALKFLLSKMDNFDGAIEEEGTLAECAAIWIKDVMIIDILNQYGIFNIKNNDPKTQHYGKSILELALENIKGRENVVERIKEICGNADPCDPRKIEAASASAAGDIKVIDDDFA